MLNILNTVAELFILMFIGYLTAKRGIFDPSTNKKFSYLVCNLALPALIISSVLGIDNSGGMKQIGIYLLGGILYYGVMLLCSVILCKLIRVPAEDAGAYQLMLIFSNCSFMGYPVMEAFLGQEAIFVNSIFNLPFNILIYSYGIYLITKGNGAKASFDWHNLINAGSIASILAIIIYALHITFPSAITLCLQSLGSVTTPLSMIVLGVSLAQIPLKETLTSGIAYRMCICRLIILPIIIYFLANLLTSDKLLMGVAVCTAAMPVASLCVMLNTLYGGKEKTTAIGVCLSTLCSVVTIPLLLTILF
jgi:hypothetical protein